MRVSWRFSWVAALMPLLLGACDGDDDSCTGGTTMSNARVEGDFDATAAMPELHVRWNAGTGPAADLPASYFDRLELADDTETEVKGVIESVSHSSERELIVKFRSLSEILQATSELALKLQLPDRNTAIDCEHPGMADRYLITLTLAFDDQSQLTDLSYSEQLVAGAI
jgi:hypothetical protein